jgi:RNA polymerase sigma-70 factor, ECF subfamily
VRGTHNASTELTASAGKQVGAQNPRQIDEDFARSYEELRQLARILARRGGAQSMSATSLVNEVWLKLAHSKQDAPHSPLHLKYLAARAMRQVLVDLSRRKSAQRRGAGQVFVTFDERFFPDARLALGPEILALHTALDALGEFAPRQASLLEARFFGGFSWDELAIEFDISESTVMREWRVARAWLARELETRHTQDPDRT